MKREDHSSQYLESEMTPRETCINTNYSNNPFKQWNRDLFTDENKLGLTSSERGTRLSQKSHDTTSLVSDIWSNSSTLNRNGGSSTMNKETRMIQSLIRERERETERDRQWERERETERERQRQRQRKEKQRGAGEGEGEQEISGKTVIDREKMRRQKIWKNDR